MKDATEFVPMEVKEEPMDQQGSSSHFPSSSAGVDGVRHPERAGYLIIDSSDDLKKEVKEEPFEDHSYATLPTSSSSQQTSGAGDLRSPPRDFKEEDVWVKDEPIEEVDPLAINTTTFTPKPESTWTKDSDGQHTPHTAEGRTARLHVAAATLPQEPAADRDDSGSDTDEATQLEDLAYSNAGADTDSGPSPERHVPTISSKAGDSAGSAMEPPAKRQKIAADERLETFRFGKKRASEVKDIARELHEKQLEVFKAKQEILEIQLASAKKELELQKAHIELRHQLQLVHSKELRQLQSKLVDEEL